ncbi:sensor histidine kinase [Shimazuella sp. AN120528]|uniref:sensor histidine kinase n=1 Tax=Shimazuella soli TaxID=1892854 RepID=UPI001F115CC0|nr:sensor histidine kinase [Shimazuella soli]MCH5583983.1 sensor histidine kinase [Shimazuella soli]
MKLFLREHLVLIFLYLLQLAAISLVFWYGEYQNSWIVSYALFLGLACLICYLLYRYIRYRAFYQRLTHLPKTLKETVMSLSDATIAKKVQQLLVTQYRFYQEQLQRYQVKQEDHLAFVNLWVHQMKTPLSVISLILQEQASPAFDSIRDEIEKVSSGLEMILYASRLDAFEKDFRVEKLNLSSLLKRILHENKRLFIQHHIMPKLEVDSSLMIFSDEKWLGFVMKQLLTNAVRYSAGKGKTVNISAFQHGNRIVVEIEDQGIGIPPQDIHRVFESHYTGENGRHYRESTGMGLFLVQEICSKLSHHISLRSEVNVGTTICIEFYNNDSYQNVSLIS